MGYQMKDVDDISSELGLPSSQVLAKFYEACKKINATLNAVVEDTVAKEIGIEDTAEVELQGPVKQSLNQELTKAAKDLERKQRKELSKLMGEDLAQYRIKGSDLDWGQALASGKPSLVSVKSGEKRLGDDSKEIDELIEAHSDKKKKKKKHSRNNV